MFSACRPASVIRGPWTTSATARLTPFRVTASTLVAMRSIQVVAPGSAHVNLTVVTETKVAPVPVTSRTTS